MLQQRRPVALLQKRWLVAEEVLQARCSATAELVPGAAAGDFRTGRQLLADAAADRRRSIAAMAACPRGRAELNTLAAAVEVLAYGPGGGSLAAP